MTRLALAGLFCLAVTTPAFAAPSFRSETAAPQRWSDAVGVPVICHTRVGWAAFERQIIGEEAEAGDLRGVTLGDDTMPGGAAIVLAPKLCASMLHPLLDPVETAFAVVTVGHEAHHVCCSWSELAANCAGVRNLVPLARKMGVRLTRVGIAWARDGMAEVCKAVGGI